MGGEALGVFLFTDVVGSTRLWASHTDAMRSDLATHDELMRSAIGDHGGREFSTAGDSFAAAFDAANDAVSAAIAAQQGFARYPWSVPDGLAVRMGVHLGSAQRRGDDWFGPPLNETARIMGTGHGGQIVVSDVVATMVRDRHAVRELGEHRLRDLDGVWRLHQIDVPGSPNDHPPLRSLQTGRTTLPRRRTPLIGREQLVGSLQHLLDQHRLVTLVGPGGAGKTHSATEAAGRILSTVRDGAFFVDLTKVRPGDDVTVAFLDGLSLAAPPDADARNHFITQMSTREAIVVVDNCEHVIDAAADVIDELLDRAPGVRVLATSREALDLDGEHLHRIPPLDASSQSSPAVRLFVERALAIDADLTFDDGAMAIISEIAQRLDGMPLAIELAAARVRTMSPAQIRDHLSDRFRLLTSGRQRGRQRRQQTLEAAIEWSYDLLDVEEQRAFRWLAVASGGFTLATAAGLLGVDDVTAADLIDSLVAKSLLNSVEFGEQRAYRLLETLSEFGLARLAAEGELDAAELALEQALLPPDELRTDWNRVNEQFGEWSERVAIEVVTRRQAAGRALAEDRIEEAAVLAFSATYPDEPGALDGLRGLILDLSRRADELSPSGWWYARHAFAIHSFFTGRGAACLSICDEALAELGDDDGRRSVFEAWRIFVLGSLLPTEELLSEVEKVTPTLRRFAHRPSNFALCAAESTYAARLMLVGTVDEALQHSREAYSWAALGGASEAQSLALHLQLLRRSGQPLGDTVTQRIATLRDRDLGIQNAVAIADAVSADAPVEERARRLGQVARRRPLGRYHREETQFLVAFARLALELGDHDRARALTDVAMPWDIPSYVSHYEVRSVIDRWSDFDECLVEESRRIYSHEHLAVADRAPVVLAEELVRWDDQARFQGQARNPLAPDGQSDHEVTTIGVLGPLEVVINGEAVTISAPKQRAILELLALEPGRTVSATDLVDAAWGDDPAQSAMGSLRSQISRLRKLIGADVLEGDSSTGYRLVVRPESVDTYKFSALLDDAATRADAERVDSFRSALDLWRGEPVADLADSSIARAAVVGLIERRSVAEEDLAAAMIETGAASGAVALLERLVEEEPLRERRWMLLVDALVSADRTADALRAYQRARHRLVEELGIEPGPALREAEARALAGETTARRPAPPAESAAAFAPSGGVVTVVFTDIEGSTPHWQNEPDEMRAALARHDELIDQVLRRHHGRRFAHTGDGVGAEFDRPDAALAAALDIQTAVDDETWPTTAPIRVRIGVHSGMVDRQTGNVVGPTVNLAARVADAGHGGQIVLSAATRGLLSADAQVTPLGEFVLRGVAHPVGLHQAGATPFPPLRAAERSRGELPMPPGELIGRAELVTRARRLLVDAPVVTLVGTGGAGKTRVALEIAYEEQPNRPGGAWFVALTGVDRGDDVAATVAAALQLQVGSSDPTDQLARVLGDLGALVVLDNCEHVLDDVALLVEAIIDRGGEARVLATSREALDLDVEQIVTVAPLDAADASSPAVTLFEARACRILPDFVLDPSTTPAVLEVCQTLDGLPLAIELAAARLATMSVFELREMLDDRFRLLGGARRRRSRARTLEQTLEWSYGLLHADEQRAFRRLGAFTSWFDREAASAVCDIDVMSTVDLLEALASKSLLVVRHEEEGTSYRLLETLRAYAEELLDRQDDLADARDAHLDHVIERVRVMAEHATPTLDELRSCRTLGGEVPSAQRWATDRGRSREAAVLAIASADLYCYLVQGRMVGLDEALAEPELDDDLRDHVLARHLARAIVSIDLPSVLETGDRLADSDGPVAVLGAAYAAYFDTTDDRAKRIARAERFAGRLTRDHPEWSRVATSYTLLRAFNRELVGDYAATYEICRSHLREIEPPYTPWTVLLACCLATACIVDRRPEEALDWLDAVDGGLVLLTSEPIVRAVALAFSGRVKEAEELTERFARDAVLDRMPSLGNDAMVGLAAVALAKGDRDTAVDLIDRSLSCRSLSPHMLGAYVRSIADPTIEFDTVRRRRLRVWLEADGSVEPLRRYLAERDQ